MDEKIEITEKAVRKSARQEGAFVYMLNDEMEMLILSLGYRKESDTANEILQELLKEENLENVYFTDENGDIRNRQVIRIEKIKYIAEKYGVVVK